MKHISKMEYEKVVEWLTDANNYKGITPHDVEGTGHCLEINGISIEVAWSGPDDFSNDTIYLVHADVYRKWRELYGYIITF